uniref:uncharacterized protein n=1 Tax=Myxine glutinosa TaxID=7769 RepID=UPI00358ECDB1
MTGHVTNKDQQPMRGNMVVPRASVDPGSSVGEHENKDSIPDYIVQVKVESDLMDDWSSQGEGEAHPVKTENFQSNLLQNSQDDFSKEQIKQEVCDFYPRKLSNAVPLIKALKKSACTTSVLPFGILPYARIGLDPDGQGCYRRAPPLAHNGPPCMLRQL